MQRYSFALAFALLLILGAASGNASGSPHAPLTYVEEGLTYSQVDPKALPVLNIYNPETQENEPTIEYSFEELDHWFTHPRFRKWNDLSRVCASMRIMFGRASAHCSNVPAYLTPATARAYVQFEIVPPPVHTWSYVQPRVVVLTDPLTPPWAPTNQYTPYWPW